MSSNYLTSDPILGNIDLDDKLVTEAWLVDQFVGSALFAAGYNSSFGSLGLNDTTGRSSPTQVGTLVNWKQIAASGGSAPCAGGVKTDGTLWTWGGNNNAGTAGYGVLGNGTTTNYSSPIQIGLLTNWKQIEFAAATGSSNLAAAIKTDGTLWTWGPNFYGQLGNGTAGNYYSSPIQVGTLTNWKQVACGSGNVVSIKTDGTLWAWGNNQYGQLGNGVTITYSSPIQIGKLTDWKQVSLNYHATFAIKTDGTLWAWGWNPYGNLGNGTSIDYSSPVQIGSLTNWKQIDVSTGAVSPGIMAIKTDGTLWGWGRNYYSELGIGNSIAYSSPIQIGSLTNWKQVSGGEYSFGATKTDGTLWTWGRNNYGQLGNGTTVDYSSPIQIGSLTNWKAVFCGYNLTFATTYKDMG